MASEVLTHDALQLTFHSTKRLPVLLFGLQTYK